MKFKRNAIFYCLVWSLLFIAAKASTASLPVYSQVFDETRNPFADAKAALALAKQTNRKVLIKVGGNWCGWCLKMDNFIKASPEVYNELHQNFVLLKINVSDVNDNADFMKGLPPVMGYPHLYVSSNDGSILLSKDSAELLNQSGENYSQNQWLAFITKWKS